MRKGVPNIWEKVVQYVESINFDMFSTLYMLYCNGLRMERSSWASMRWKASLARASELSSIRAMKLLHYI